VNHLLITQEKLWQSVHFGAKSWCLITEQFTQKAIKPKKKHYRSTWMPYYFALNYLSLYNLLFLYSLNHAFLSSSAALVFLL